jgi:3-hydroxybutyryl-CoA dehydrogenase
MKSAPRKNQKISKRTVSKKTQGKSVTAPNPIHKSPSIYITGESPMVEQYAEICSGHGYNAFISWNEAPAQKPSFKSSNITISASIPSSVSVAIELTNMDPSLKRKNIEKIGKAVSSTVPILSSSLTVTATEQASWISHRHRLVGISALPGFIDSPLVEVAPTIYSPKETIEAVSRFYISIGRSIEIVQDRIGMVLPRIICQLINEASFAITEDIASPRDIDKVMKLGLRFPLGPIEWGEKIGLNQVNSVLSALHSDLQEERYRISPLLRQMGFTGQWWKKI